MATIPPSSLPSTVSRGLDSAVSMNSVDPPMAVHAKPITTPGGVVSYIRSEVNKGLPTKSFKLSVDTDIGSRDSSGWSAVLVSVGSSPVGVVGSVLDVAGSLVGVVDSSSADESEGRRLTNL